MSVVGRSVVGMSAVRAVVRIEGVRHSPGLGGEFLCRPYRVEVAGYLDGHPGLVYRGL